MLKVAYLSCVIVDIVVLSQTLLNLVTLQWSIAIREWIRDMLIPQQEKLDVCKKLHANISVLASAVGHHDVYIIGISDVNKNPVSHIPSFSWTTQHFLTVMMTVAPHTATLWGRHFTQLEGTASEPQPSELLWYDAEQDANVSKETPERHDVIVGYVWVWVAWTSPSLCQMYLVMVNISAMDNKKCLL